MSKENRIIMLLTGTNTRLLNVCLLLLRCTVGVILFMVGSGKVLGWFGGMGMELTLQAFAKGGFSAPLVYLSSYTEFLGGALLVIGFLTRPVAVAVTINMFVATLTMLPHGFIMGFADFPFSILISSIIILLAGPMDFSIDQLLLRSKAGGQA